MNERPGGEAAYERPLGDAITGNGAFFTREDAVEAAWAVVEPVLDTIFLPCSAPPKPVARNRRHHESLAFAEHGKMKKVLPVAEGHAEAVLAEFPREGVNDEALAADLQRGGTAAFAKSWGDLMSRIAAKNEMPTKARRA